MKKIVKLLNYKSLEQFLKKGMKMTHIYQPIMIRTLLKSENKKTTVDMIARQFLSIDESQINYYKKITKRWPHQTLKAHNIVSYARKESEYTLLLDDITPEQKQRLIELCNLRLEEFISKDPWIKKFRELDARSIGGSVRYDIIAKAKGICVACGMKPLKVGLDVDHIIPRSLGGKTELNNLQALCYRCNRGKRNRDEIDFMLEHKRLQYRRKDCEMCNPTKIILENHLAHAVFLNDSDTDLHSLIMPNRHVDSFVELIPAEKNLCITLVDNMMSHIKEKDKSIKKFDVLFDKPSNHYAINVIPQK